MCSNEPMDDYIDSCLADRSSHVARRGRMKRAETFDTDYCDLLKKGGFHVVQEPESLTDPLLQLISLQKALGSWEMDSSMAKVLKSDDELAKLMPVGADKAVWATTLALIWRYGLRLEAWAEWQFVAMKAASWIQAQKVDCVSQCVQAGNALLGCQVQQKTLGLSGDHTCRSVKCVIN
ncbi:von Willebrand factor A domain-containing protein 5A-like [Clupea harengus]|uniref:von Willebrand factor A domain-containing protein 5A-like n=1 Tax=Clupea harengus TaxID=7950 RepID=A0A6P8G0Z8_CLUHA|nr:von Willebrand factor A domain-containing protein 5A-like [Clupea harengus]